VPLEEIAAQSQPYSPATVYDWLLDAGLIRKIA
jgi:hypothetical protein